MKVNMSSPTVDDDLSTSVETEVAISVTLPVVVSC